MPSPGCVGIFFLPTDLMFPKMVYVDLDMYLCGQKEFLIMA